MSNAGHNALPLRCPHCVAGGYKYSEAWRHACEVRYVLSLPDRTARWAYVEGARVDGRFVKGVRQVRGDVAADRLRDDVAAAWRRRRHDSSDADVVVA